MYRIRPFHTVFTEGNSLRVGQLTGRLEKSHFVISVNGADFALAVLGRGKDISGSWAEIEPQELAMRGGFRLRIEADPPGDNLRPSDQGLAISVLRDSQHLRRAAQGLVARGRDPEAAQLLTRPDRAMAVYIDAEGYVIGQAEARPLTGNTPVAEN